MKSRFLKISLLISVPVLVLVSVLYAGSLSPTVTTETPTMVTLSDINNLILNNVTTATSSDHSVSTTSSPTTTYVSVSELYANLANLIQPEYIKTGETVLGITGTFMQPQDPRTQVSTSSTSLTPSVSPEATGYTLEDIYNLINSNSTTTEASHSFTNSSSVSSSMRSLSSLYYDLSTLINPAHIATGTTYLGVTGTYFPDITGLVAHFKMNDNSESTVVENTVDTDTAHVAGILGNAYSSADFSSDPYGVIFSTGIPINTGTSDYTFSAWVYRNSDWGQDTIFADPSGGWYGHFGIEENGLLRVFNTDNGGPYFNNTQVTSGSWHHVVITEEGGTVKLYLDGLIDSDPYIMPGNTVSIYESISIGGAWGFDGLIDEVGIWTRALSDVEIAGLYNGGAGIVGDINNAPFNSGFLAGWHLDGGNGTSDPDFSGNGYNGTVSGAPSAEGTSMQNTNTISTTGKINGALNFNGLSDYVDAGPILGLHSTSYTISVWVKPEDKGSGVNGILRSSAWNGDGLGYYFRINADNSDKIEYWYGYDLGWQNYTLTSSSPIDYGVWTHITIVHNLGQTTDMYINGVLDVSLSTPSPIYTYTPSFRIGDEWDDGGSRLFYGAIDDVRIYNQALSEAEIKALYFMGSGTEEE